MSNEPDIRTESDRPAEPRSADGDHLDPDLDSVVVSYDDRPDRRTVFPRGLSGVDRMSTWLTASDDAFVGLEDAR